jgi:hypothetical protein
LTLASTDAHSPARRTRPGNEPQDALTERSR